MGVLEHYVYAYQTFSGYVEYSYTPAPVCSEDYSCKACPGEGDWDGCPSGKPICDNSNIVKCGCFGDDVTTGSGSALKTASCDNTPQGQQCTSITCNNGYTRVGYPTCQSSGYWDGLTTSCSPVRDVRALCVGLSFHFFMFQLYRSN